MKFERASGLLLHPSSLPGQFGIGDLGSEAFRFIDILAEARQTYWQILPLGPTGYGDSPYQCFSAFAGNTLLMSPEKLIDDGLISSHDIETKPGFHDDKVDFGAVHDWKNVLLSHAYKGFIKYGGDDLINEFEIFCDENGWWLDDYAAYRSIKRSHGQKPWFKWPEALRRRDEKALRNAVEKLTDEIRAEKFYQFLFFRQWRAVKDHADQSGIKIIGDIPIFVAHDSADVWADQGEFRLNADGTPKVVSGVPPDYFSKTGQLWGNPIYDWDVMRAGNFRWWIARVRSMLNMVDVVRLDHFRGFAASWEVPGGDKTAENGHWVDAPGKELFTSLQNEFGELPVIAEDLGAITPDVEELRDRFEFPGMRILQFAFGGDARNHDLPHNYVRNCVAYTGTHDNDTTAGWFLAQAAPSSKRDTKAISPVQEHCLTYLNADGSEISWDFIRAIWASVADIAITPVQDLLGLGNQARMNLPASTSGNWQWRMRPDAFTDDIVERLKNLTITYGRDAAK